MRIKFTGPDGAKFAGRELVAITDDQRARTDAIAAAEHATGEKITDLGARSRQSSGLTTQLALFFTLRGAGFWVTWDEAGAITARDYEVIAEPSDPVASDPPAPGADDDAPYPGASDRDAAEPDPTSARTVSAPGAGDAPHRRPGKAATGSKTRSARAS